MTDKDAVIKDIEQRWKDSPAGMDVSWLVNECQWMRDLLRRQWPEGQRPGWVDLVLDDRGMAP